MFPHIVSSNMFFCHFLWIPNGVDGHYQELADERRHSAPLCILVHVGAGDM